MSLNKDSVYCVMPRSSKPPDTCKWGGTKRPGILEFSLKLWWSIQVANLATNFQDLVAKMKNLVALAPVLGAISCPVVNNAHHLLTMKSALFWNPSSLIKKSLIHSRSSREPSSENSAETSVCWAFSSFTAMPDCRESRNDVKIFTLKFPYTAVLSILRDFCHWLLT